MASSSAECSAPRAPPPPDQLAAFYKLVDKQTTASVLCRHARSADLSSQAALEAEALFVDDSLVISDLQMSENTALTNLAREAGGAEKEALHRRAWAVLVSAINLLLRRLEADTVLPGTLREEELDYEAHSKASVFKAKNEPVPPPFLLRSWASMLGYVTLLNAMVTSLHLLRYSYWPTVQKRVVESCVLRGLDVIP